MFLGLFLFTYLAGMWLLFVMNKMLEQPAWWVFAAWPFLIVADFVLWMMDRR